MPRELFDGPAHVGGRDVDIGQGGGCCRRGRHSGRGEGGGGPEFRRQMRIPADFMNGFEFEWMAPREDVVSLRAATDLSARALVEEGRQYAIYVSLRTRAGLGQDPLRALATTTLPTREADLIVTPPAGRYEATWVSPTTGPSPARERFDHQGGARTLRTPAFTPDIAEIVRAGG